MAESQELINNNNARDWSDLPADILHCIAKKLPDLLEFVRFRAVCKSWRSSAPPSDPPPQMPWLLEISGRSTYSEQLSEGQLRFYSITSGKTVIVPVERYVWFRGALCHYLPSYDDLEDIISLYNPLTQKEIVYPFIHTIPHLMLMPWMGWTGTSSIHDRNILIVDRESIPNEIGRWAFYDAKHKTWTDGKGFFYNFCYCQGKLFSIHHNYNTEVIDTSSKKLLYTIPPPKEGYDRFDEWLRWPHLVESSGEILLVSWLENQATYGETEEEPMFQIHRLDFGGEDGQPCWIRISDIGNQIIFLEMRNSFSMTAAPSNTGFKGGCIYYTNGEELCAHHVVTGTVEKVPCPFEKCAWFLPSLN